MANQLFLNNAATTLSGSLTQGGTTIVLASGSGSKFPAPTGGDFFYVTLYEKDVANNEENFEVVKVTARTADSLTVERDIESITGFAGGLSFPTVIGRTVFIELRWTAGCAAMPLQKGANLADLSNAASARTNIGLGNVDNVADADKPVSTAQALADIAVLNAAAVDAGSQASAAVVAERSATATLSNKTLTSTCNVSASSGQPFSFRNILVNSTFQVNNGNAGTPYVSSAALTVGQYGHEMWKAGASGGDYSFTQNPAITQITIAAGKSLIQVLEDKFVEGGAYILSWTGTAQARVTINSSTPSGSFASSPILVTGQTVGTTMCVEFSAGTLSKPQLEVGSIATKFEFRQDELQRTQRYFAKLGSFYIQTNSITTLIVLPCVMRTTPAIIGGGAGFAASILAGSIIGYCYQTTLGLQSIFVDARL